MADQPVGAFVKGEADIASVTNRDPPAFVAFDKRGIAPPVLEKNYLFTILQGFRNFHVQLRGEHRAHLAPFSGPLDISNDNFGHLSRPESL